MLSLKTMIAVTPAAVREKALECSAALTREKKIENGKELKFRVRSPGKKVKDVIIRMYPGDKAWVSCTCDYFLFKCEVALATKGSSDIIHSNGKMPKKTNPLLKPIVCKHIIACAPQALRTGKARNTGKRL